MANKKLIIIGHGFVFDSVMSDPESYGLGSRDFQTFRFDDVKSISLQADTVLSGFDVADFDFFIAVDENALNFARLELFSRVKIRGAHVVSLIHHSAQISASARLGVNVFVGPGCIIEFDCKIGNNTLINSVTRIGAKALIADHVWVGSGCRIGSSAKIGKNTVLANDQQIRNQVILGRNCYLDGVVPWRHSIADGTFFESIYNDPAVMIGSGYSWNS